MALTSLHQSMADLAALPAGGGPASRFAADAGEHGAERRRRRRAVLEAYFSPIVSQAARPSAVDRLVLWRSRHGHRCT